MRKEGEDEWSLAMRRGDFESAWRVTDRLEGRRGERARGKDLLWNGDDPTGRRVAVRCLHGLGDTLQFSRFLPLLNEITSELLVFPQPALVSLLEQQDGFGEAKNGWTQCPELGSALEVEVMELAYLFRTTPTTLPAPQLRPPATHNSVVLPLANNPRLRNVAIFWAASGWGGGRYVPLTVFNPLAALPDIRFFSFQQGAFAREAETSALPIRPMSQYTTEICDLARALAQMDAVLAVDSMAAHLAGSLRVPVYLLLESGANWRWLEGRNDSPWYPEMRIFWRRRSWDEVIEKVAQELSSPGRMAWK